MGREEHNVVSGKPGRKEIIIFIIMFAAAAVLAGIVAVNRSLLGQKPVYVIESASEMAFGSGGSTLVIDNGKKTLLVLNEDGKLKKRYDGGEEQDLFFYATHCAQSSDGSIYISDITYGRRGNLLDRERLIRIGKGGREVLYEIDYTGMEVEDIPLQYGHIVELQESGGEIYFTLNYADRVEVKKADQSGGLTDVAVFAAEAVRTDAAYDIQSGMLAAAERTGTIRMYDGSGDSSVLVQEEGGMPFDMAARSGEVYYTELTDMTVRHFPVADPEKQQVFYQSDSLLYQLDVSADGNEVLATDNLGFYRLHGDGSGACASSEYVDSAGCVYYPWVIVLWAFLIVSGLIFAALAARMLYWIVISVISNENSMRVMLIILTCLAVFFILSYMLLSRLLDASTTASEKQTSLFSELLMLELEPEEVSQLGSPADHDTELYARIKAPLDKHIWNYYEKGEFYYYVIYRILDGKIAYLMDFEDTLPVTYPVYEDDPEDNVYAEVLHTGESFVTSEISSYGAWTFMLSPIRDSEGNIIALLEVGQSLDAIERSQTELRRELLINAAVSTVVLTMLLLELIFLIGFLQKKMKLDHLDDVESVPVRTIMFISYVADSMQDAFIAILCSQLYGGGLPVSDSVAIALPMSAQLLMMAIMSFFAGRLTEIFGSKKVISTGMLIQMAGFICCFAGGNYPAILMGKMLIGCGMGLVYVGCNTAAAACRNSEVGAAAFAGISAGILSGVTIGAGLASVLLSLGGWRTVYGTGAVIVFLGVLLSLSSGSVHPAAGSQDAADSRGEGFGAFLLNRRVLGFFAMMLLPFMMSLSYREYFFPLFAQERGITEVRIGQIYLVCGMAVIYLGPALSELMLRVFGALWSIIIASAAMGLCMLLFVIHPGLLTVMIGVVVLSVVISFAYTCQYSYFDMVPEARKYGAGKSMGVYSVVESLGQTIGPVTYGALLSFGYREGIGIFASVMLGLTLIFMLLMAKEAGNYKEEAE